MEEDPSVTLARLTPRQRECALERYGLLRPCLEEGMTQSWVAREQQVSMSTVQRWMRVYREKGLSGLAPVGRADRGKARGVPEELIRLIEGLGLERIERPVSAIHALVREVAEEQGWREPSYGQVYRITRSLPGDVKTLAREGATGYRERYDVLYRREATRANRIWQADHCRLCIYVCDEKGERAKPWVTVILDDYSRGIASCRLGWQTPSSYQTSLALREAIRVKEDARWKICGIPEQL
jgi:putative transposase